MDEMLLLSLQMHILKSVTWVQYLFLEGSNLVLVLIQISPWMFYVRYVDCCMVQ